ncbi:MAG TPA: hypothetical protein VL336_10575 [Sphingomicrobium sp.]|nr:hypothetical protein [Sphingomicrobium sp.]
MSQSTQYDRLAERVLALRKALLPYHLKVSVGNLTHDISIKALSYRLLCHAEIESYLEDRATEVSALIGSAWKRRRHVSYPTLCMIGFSGLRMDAPPETFQAPVKQIKIDDRLSASLGNYYYYVTKQNNGITEKSLVKILLPLGIDVNIIDPLVVTEFNNFATLRGNAAHQSTAGHVQAGVSPHDEHTTVSRLIKNLKIIDKELSRVATLAM